MTFRDRMKQDVIAKLQATNNAQVKKISSLLNTIGTLQRRLKKIENIRRKVWSD